MAKRKIPKLGSKKFVFTPRGADREAHGIKYRDEGFLHLCQRLYYSDYMPDYEVYVADLRPELRGRNVATDWTGFREAMQKYQARHPPLPSMFAGRYQHCDEGHELRKRMLHAICREYQHPEALADDLWDFVRRGKPEEAENLLRILVFYFNDPSQRPECRKPFLSESSREQAGATTRPS